MLHNISIWRNNGNSPGPSKMTSIVPNNQTTVNGTGTGISYPVLATWKCPTSPPLGWSKGPFFFFLLFIICLLFAWTSGRPCNNPCSSKPPARSAAASGLGYTYKKGALQNGFESRKAATFRELNLPYGATMTEIGYLHVYSMAPITVTQYVLSGPFLLLSSTSFCSSLSIAR